jgi:hypothetical protein
MTPAFFCTLFVLIFRALGGELRAEPRPAAPRGRPSACPAAGSHPASIPLRPIKKPPSPRKAPTAPKLS